MTALIDNSNTGNTIAAAVRASHVIDGDFKPSRADILAMQREMQAACDAVGAPHAPVEVEHLFAEGLYARRYPMPAGQWAVTKTHRKKHFIVCCGDATIWVEGAMRRLVGFHVFITHPGTKRVIYAHADTLFITFHATEQTDMDEIEKDLIEPEAAADFQEVQP